MYRQFNSWVSDLAPSTKLLRMTEEDYMMFGGAIGPFIMNDLGSGKNHIKGSTEDGRVLRLVPVNGFPLKKRAPKNREIGEQRPVGRYCTQD
jgi:hypothetical protein